MFKITAICLEMLFCLGWKGMFYNGEEDENCMLFQSKIDLEKIKSCHVLQVAVFNG